MELEEVFVVLGIEKTKDKSIIKSAYRTMLTRNNPEDHPEEFKRIRQAYEAAVNYADSEDEEEKEEEQEDTTPSGLVAAEFRHIYENIALRKDVTVFEKFFQKDIFLSLDEDELCREKILVFMMGHYFFPTAVWKLLDVKLRISAGEKELKEKFPADYINFLVAKCNNGEEVNFDQFEGPEDADYDGFIRYTEKIYQALREEKLDEARQCLEAADRMGIYNPVLELSRAAILKKSGKAQEGIAVLSALYEKYPGDEVAQYNYAEALWSEGEKEQAVVIYQKLKEKNDNHYMSNVRLTEWYYEKEEYETAKKHAYCVIKFGCDDNFRDLLRRINDKLEVKYIEKIKENNHYKDKMELCWCYLQSEKLLECLKLALTLKNEVEDADRTEYIGMMAKIYVECGMFDKAEPYARGWMEALKREMPEEYERKINTAHYLIAECLHFMAGQDESLYDKAAAELEALGEKIWDEPGFLIELSHIYADAGNVKECARIAEYLEKRRIFIGHNILLEAYDRARDGGGIIEQSKVVVRYFPDMPRPYELAARVFYECDIKNGLKEVLELAGKNGVESEILNAYGYLLSKKSRPDGEKLEDRVKKIRDTWIRQFRETGDESYFRKALDELNECFNDFPNGYILVERGLLFLAAKRYEEAQRDFEKTLEDNMFNRYAWNNLGCVYLEQGFYDKAFVCFNKAISVSGGEYMLPYANIADCYEAIRYYEEEEQQYELIKQKFHRGEMDYYSSMMEVYKNLDKWEEAMRLAEKHGGTRVKYYEEILGVAIEMGRMKEAKNIVEQWKRCTIPMWPKTDVAFYRETAWYHLLTGDHKTAIKKMEKAIKAVAKDGYSSEKLEMCEEILFMLYLGNPFDKKTMNDAQVYVKFIQEFEEKGKVNFAKKKYFLYVFILTELFSGNVGKTTRRLEQMEACPRCNGCTMEVCKELMIARGMLLDLQGKENAGEIYQSLFEKYPRDKYIMALCKYKVRKKG